MSRTWSTSTAKRGLQHKLAAQLWSHVSTSVFSKDNKKVPVRTKQRVLCHRWTFLQLISSTSLNNTEINTLTEPSIKLINLKFVIQNNQTQKNPHSQNILIGRACCWTTELYIKYVRQWPPDAVCHPSTSALTSSRMKLILQLWLIAVVTPPELHAPTVVFHAARKKSHQWKQWQFSEIKQQRQPL